MIDLKEIKNKIFKKENFYFLLIILFSFGIDRYSKIEIIKNFSNTSFYFNDFLNFDLVWNTGIGFGLLSDKNQFFYNLITFFIGIVVICLFYIAIKSNKYEKIIFSLIIGGALGNFYDRLYFKAVPDFIDLPYERFHWFTFNVADIFITIGLIVYILSGFLKKNK